MCPSALPPRIMSGPRRNHHRLRGRCGSWRKDARHAWCMVQGQSSSGSRCSALDRAAGIGIPLAEFRICGGGRGGVRIGSRDHHNGYTPVNCLVADTQALRPAWGVSRTDGGQGMTANGDRPSPPNSGHKDEVKWFAMFEQSRARALSCPRQCCGRKDDNRAMPAVGRICKAAVASDATGTTSRRRARVMAELTVKHRRTRRTRCRRGWMLPTPAL